MRLKKRGNGLVSAKDNVEASASAVTAVRTPYRCDARGMAGNRQPVMNGGPDAPPFERRLSLALMPRDEEQDAVAGRDRTLQCPVDRVPRPIQAVPVKVHDPVGLDAARAQAAVPAPIERGMLMTDRRPGSGDRGSNGGPSFPGRRDSRKLNLIDLHRRSRQGPDGGRNLRPQGGLLRG